MAGGGGRRCRSPRTTACGCWHWCMGAHPVLGHTEGTTHPTPTHSHELHRVGRVGDAAHTCSYVVEPAHANSVNLLILEGGRAGQGRQRGRGRGSSVGGAMCRRCAKTLGRQGTHGPMQQLAGLAHRPPKTLAPSPSTLYTAPTATVCVHRATATEPRTRGGSWGAGQGGFEGSFEKATPNQQQQQRFRWGTYDVHRAHRLCAAVLIL
jgi:hypothetical protein